MHISIDEQQAIHALNKKIAECKIAEDITARAIVAIGTVAHHKQVNARAITAIKAAGIYASLTQDTYCPRIMLYFPQDNRVYKVSKPDSNGVSGAEYYSETQVDIYYNPADGYTGMIEAAQKRLDGLKEDRERYETELANMDKIIRDAETLAAAYANMGTYSYIIRDTFGIK